MHDPTISYEHIRHAPADEATRIRHTWGTELHMLAHIDAPIGNNSKLNDQPFRSVKFSHKSSQWTQSLPPQRTPSIGSWWRRGHWVKEVNHPGAFIKATLLLLVDWAHIDQHLTISNKVSRRGVLSSKRLRVWELDGEWGKGNVEERTVIEAEALLISPCGSWVSQFERNCSLWRLEEEFKKIRCFWKRSF